MKTLNLRDKWVLVTGASSGLGREIAFELARRYGTNLVIAGRRADRLREVEQQLKAAYGVQVAVVTADLSKVDEVDRLAREATDGRQLDAVVLNAGVTHFGPHEELSWEAFQAMLNTNVTGVVRATAQLVPHLKKTQGGMMIVSSMAGLNPVPYQTAYSATKAFLVHFGMGLWHELAGSGVTVTTFAPGGIQTEMTAGPKFKSLAGWLMPVDRCAREAVEALVQRRYLCVPGPLYRLGSVVTRLLPQQFLHSRVAATYRSSLLAASEALAQTAGATEASPAPSAARQA